jgi:transcriptional regulator with XRE-family HTH domain
METSFAHQMKALRRRLGSKQLWLAHVVGCSSAAVSFWESGKRVPDEGTLIRILEALNLAGASDRDLAWLRESWWDAKFRRLKTSA